MNIRVRPPAPSLALFPSTYRFGITLAISPPRSRWMRDTTDYQNRNIMELTCPAPQTQTVKLYPASELKKVAIEIDQEAPLHLRCMNCGIGWSPRLNPNATV